MEETVSKVKMKLLKAIIGLCNATNPNKRNTSQSWGTLRYSTGIATRADENGAKGFLKGIGFDVQHVKSTGGSTHGDFSSDLYGYTAKHPQGNGVNVSVTTWFGGEKPTFNIEISGYDHDIQAVLDGHNRQTYANIEQCARDGERIVLIIPGFNNKTMWQGLGNRSGLHDYAHTVLSNNWNKSGERFMERIRDLPKGSVISVHSFVNKNRDSGTWVPCQTYTIN